MKALYLLLFLIFTSQPLHAYEGLYLATLTQNRNYQFYLLIQQNRLLFYKEQVQKGYEFANLPCQKLQKLTCMLPKGGHIEFSFEKLSGEGEFLMKGLTSFGRTTEYHLLHQNLQDPTPEY